MCIHMSVCVHVNNILHVPILAFTCVRGNVTYPYRIGGNETAQVGERRCRSYVLVLGTRSSTYPLCVISANVCVCVFSSMSIGCGEYRRLSRGIDGALQANCNALGLDYFIIRGEDFNRCLVKCGESTVGVATLVCDEPKFVRRFLKLDSLEDLLTRSAGFCSRDRPYSCLAYGRGLDCILDPYLLPDGVGSPGMGLCSIAGLSVRSRE